MIIVVVDIVVRVGTFVGAVDVGSQRILVLLKVGIYVVCPPVVHFSRYETGHLPCRPQWYRRGYGFSGGHIINVCTAHQ